MAGLPWFELDVDMPDGPKCARLGSRLKNPLAFGYVVRLYAYCYRHGIDRFLGPGASAEVEDAAKWKGKDGVLVQALEAERFVERDGSGDGALVIHGVAERLGPHIAKRDRDARRMRDRRALLDLCRANVARTSREHPPDIPATPPERSAHVAGDKDKDIEEEDVRPFSIGNGPTPAGAVPPLPDAFVAWNQATSEALARTAPFRVKPSREAAMRADVERLGVEIAVEICVEAALESGVPKTGDWFAPILAKEQTPLPSLAPGELPGPDDPRFGDDRFYPTYQQYLDRDAEKQRKPTSSANGTTH